MCDVSSDLHFANAVLGGPIGWLGKIDVGKYKNPASTTLLIAGDTSQSPNDTVDFLNAAADHYERVIAVLGNHETECRENVHLSFDLMLVGYRLLADPRGYRGNQRDGSAWSDQFVTFL
jgi:hypothetical protein